MWSAVLLCFPGVVALGADEVNMQRSTKKAIGLLSLKSKEIYAGVGIEWSCSRHLQRPHTGNSSYSIHSTRSTLRLSIPVNLGR
jgi:hypothetical protein